MDRNQSAKKRIIVRPKRLHPLPKGDKHCERCSFVLPCLFGTDVIQLGLFARWKDTSKTATVATSLHVNSSADDLFSTRITYGECDDVRARVLPHSPLGISTAEPEWVLLPFDCPRFNTRADVWHPMRAVGR